MHKSVQDFLQTAPDGTYFETQFNRYVFFGRPSDFEYKIICQGLGGNWREVPAFKVSGEFVPGTQRSFDVGAVTIH